MNTVPLCCYICPQEPDFSDLSHLLTHVSSKGHLAHYLKAQLRGLGDHEVREKLDAYDQWYKRYQIEQLLSQRLSAKASKHGFRNERKPSKKSTQVARTLKSRPRKLKSPSHRQSPVKAEPAIDPQLSHLQAPPQHAPESLIHREDPSFGQTRLHVPHMSDLQHWQTQTPLSSYETSYSGDHGSVEHPITSSNTDNEANSSVENDYFKAFVRSPSRTAYPESPDLKPPFSMSQPLQPKESPETPRALNGCATSDREEKEGFQGDLDPYISPILKGIKWPGMSLFDSACAEAQRLRNQKKDRSILEQMAQNSSLVEQMEYIYWPDGTLKKSRFITGNVESSPMSQTSPVPKRSRRTRTSKPRSVLADLGTNGLTLPKKTSRKSKTGRASLDLRGGKNASEANPDHSITTSDVLRSVKRKVVAERCLLEDSPSLRPSRRNFDVPQDISGPIALVSPNRFPQPRDPYDSDSRHSGARYNSNTPIPSGSAASLDWYTQPRSYPRIPDTSGVTERLPTRPKPQAHGELPQEPTGRVTQRYFSVTGDEEPQFFATMPPQMEFGGMAGPKYRGATLNPLNPYLRWSQLQPSRLL